MTDFVIGSQEAMDSLVGKPIVINGLTLRNADGTVVTVNSLVVGKIYNVDSNGILQTSTFQGGSS